ncbi:MAG: hypothetical protein ACYC5O_14295 [Anaerolineae bacterium]
MPTPYPTDTPLPADTATATRVAAPYATAAPRPPSPTAVPTPSLTAGPPTPAPTAVGVVAAAVETATTALTPTVVAAAATPLPTSAATSIPGYVCPGAEVLAFWAQAEDTEAALPGLQVLPIPPANSVRLWLVVRSRALGRVSGTVYGPFGLPVASLQLQPAADADALRAAVDEAAALRLLAAVDLAAIDDAIAMETAQVYVTDYAFGSHLPPGDYRFEVRLEGIAGCEGPPPTTSVAYQSLVDCSIDFDSIAFVADDGSMVVTGDSLPRPGDGHPTIANDGNSPLNLQVQFGVAGRDSSPASGDAYRAGLLGVAADAAVGEPVLLPASLPIHRAVAIHFSAAAAVASSGDEVSLSVWGQP